MSRSKSVLESSAAVLRDDGILAWSLETVASRAKCAKGLLLYHYRSKAGLLAATAEFLETEQTRRRLQAAQDGGETALDHLFAVLVADVRDGWFGARVGLAAAGFVAAPRQTTGVPARIGAALGSPESLADSEQAIESMLDGLSFRLLTGTNVELVREAYDRLWLGLLT